MKSLINPPFSFSSHTHASQKRNQTFFFNYIRFTKSKQIIIKHPLGGGRNCQFKNSNSMLQKEEDMKIYIFSSSNFPGRTQDWASSFFVEHNPLLLFYGVTFKQGACYPETEIVMSTSPVLFLFSNYKMLIWEIKLDFMCVTKLNWLFPCSHGFISVMKGSLSIKVKVKITGDS